MTYRSGWLALCALTLAGFMFTPALTDLSAAEETTPSAPEGSDLSAQWAALMQQRQDFVSQVEKLQASLEKATPEEQRAAVTEFRKLQAKFQKEVLPRVAELAPQVYAADPTNFVAGEAALEMVFQQNKYDEAIRIGEALLSAKHETMIAQNVTGVAQFAVSNFARAKELFVAAEKANQLHPQLGGRFAESVAVCSAAWEAEQKIRAIESAATGDAQLPRVLFKTNKGDLEIELFENEAPNTVANFISLVTAKKYDGVAFHRVISGFMVQGGDPNSLDDDPSNDGQGGPGYVIRCECHQPNARKHFRGTLSMAHAGRDTGGSQFFITHLPTPHLDGTPESEGGHTVFGRVINDTGFDVVAGIAQGDKIVSATVIRQRNHAYVPETQPE